MKTPETQAALAGIFSAATDTLGAFLPIFSSVGSDWFRRPDPEAYERHPELPPDPRRLAGAFQRFSLPLRLS